MSRARLDRRNWTRSGHGAIAAQRADICQNATGLSLAEAADNELHGQLWWSRGRRDELATALDEWENEGGGISR